MKRMETILVTGGAGFIGSHVVERLLNEQHRVILVDNFADTYPRAFKEQNIASLRNHTNLLMREFDITDPVACKKLFSEHTIDRLIHLAARAGVRQSLADPFPYFVTNVLGTVNLLHAARTAKLSQVIVISSSSVYGNNPTPFKETDSTDAPISPYGASKKGTEVAAYTFHALTQVPMVVLRLFSVYGPRGRPDMAPYLFTEALLKDQPVTLYSKGTMARDWTYITDIVDGILACFSHHRPFTIINLGNNCPVTTKKLLTTIAGLLGVQNFRVNHEESQGDVPCTHADITLAQKLLGWYPKISLSEGLAHSINWYKKERLS